MEYLYLLSNLFIRPKQIHAAVFNQILNVFFVKTASLEF